MSSNSSDDSASFHVKRSTEELEKMLLEAAEKVGIGSLYAHKKSGRKYETTDVAMLEGVVLVIYRSVESNLSRFARPLSEFLDKFDKADAPHHWTFKNGENHDITSSPAYFEVREEVIDPWPRLRALARAILLDRKTSSDESN